MDDEARPTEDGQLLGQVAGLDLDLVEQLMDGVVPFAQELEDADPRGMAEGPKELGLGLIQGYRHGGRTSGSHEPA